MDAVHRAQRRLLPRRPVMTPDRPARGARVVAFIKPGARPHLIASTGITAPDLRLDVPPLPRLDTALGTCLATLEGEPERFQRAAMVWHARWCTLLPELTLTEA